MIKHVKIPVDKLEFDCRISGNQYDELVILLHGFPETSFMWQKLMTETAGLGFYCVAPNLRGYSKGARPSGKKHYRLNSLAMDILRMAEFLGKDKFHLVGHDWGAAIGWKVVHDSPSAILSWTGLSVPHLQAFGEAIVKDPRQRRMSRYVKRFQWPVLPELSIRKNDFALFRKLWKHSTREEIEDYLSIFMEPNALTAALNYYRSNYNLLKEAAKKSVLGDIIVPTLFIWGNKDMAIGASAVENGHKFMKGDYQFLELDAGHWLIQTRYLEIKSAIFQHLTKYKSASKIS